MNRLLLALTLATALALTGCGAAPAPATRTGATVQVVKAAPVVAQPAKVLANTATPRSTPVLTLTPVPPFTPTPEPTFDDFAEDPKLPTPTPTGVPLVTTEKEVNLRSGPGTNYEVTGALSPGQSFDIIGRNADSSWWQIAVDDKPAWVAASVVKATNADQGIEVVEAPPPPTPTPAPTPTQVPTVAPTPTVVVPAPPPAVAPDRPAGASAKCNDGSYSFSANRRGTCSHHGGVAIWY